VLEPSSECPDLISPQVGFANCTIDGRKSTLTSIVGVKLRLRLRLRLRLELKLKLKLKLKIKIKINE
jgi:hypothetical protein